MEPEMGKPGRPGSGQAQTPAQRKRAQRLRDALELAQKPAGEWPERICLLVLASPEHKALAHSAWLRLGELRGFF